MDDPEAAVPLAGALLEGGIDAIEITFRTAAAAESITRIRTALPDMLVGAGTVLTAEQADRAIDAGAGFGLAPGFNSEVVVHFNGRGGHFIPGVMTPSDIERALDVDCTLMKFFPAGPAGGIPMLKALAGPLRRPRRAVLSDRRHHTREHGRLSRTRYRICGRRLLVGHQGTDRRSGLVVYHTPDEGCSISLPMTTDLQVVGNR